MASCKWPDRLLPAASARPLDPMKTVLLVDDDPVVVAVYQRRLERDGFKVVVARDGLSALEMLSQSAPDIVVLDLMMPNINGVEVLKYMRAEPHLRRTPVIVFSNAYMTDLSKEAFEAGADKGLPKAGCTPSLLSQCVRDLLAGSVGVADTSQLLAAHPTESSRPSRVEKTEPEHVPPGVKPAPPESAVQPVPANIRAEFIKRASVELAEIREHCAGYLAAYATAAGVIRLKNLYQCLHFVSARASLAGFHRIAQLAAAFEALVFELVVNPALATDSTVNTIARAMECLSALFGRIELGPDQAVGTARVIVIDDDAVSNRVIVSALQRAGLEAESVTDPRLAIEQLQSIRYDLIFIDIVMPGMSGLELYEEIRRMPGYADTPVIFITVHDRFQTYLKTALTGGNDIISKPVFPLELALKATTDLIQHQLRCCSAARHD